MPGSIKLTDALRLEYDSLFNSCVLDSDRTAEVAAIVKRMDQGRSRYEDVSGVTGVPWHVIAVIHNMESSQRFDRHLHNGDPLSARTVQVPPGRPKEGQPPFTWEQSAIDALTFDGLAARTDWSLSGTLFTIEKFNGLGYRLQHPEVLSPYLWGASRHYSKGKFIADSKWSPTAKSAQCGAGTLLRRLAELHLVEFEDQPLPAVDGPPLVRFSVKASSDPDVKQRAINLQLWLNSFPGIFVKVDGAPGPRTADAFRRVTGHFLPGDPNEPIS